MCTILFYKCKCICCDAFQEVKVVLIAAAADFSKLQNTFLSRQHYMVKMCETLFGMFCEQREKNKFQGAEPFQLLVVS